MLSVIKAYIKTNYGSKRGLLNSAKYKALYYSGAYKGQMQIDWQRVKRTIFVCHGNICRSSLAECYAKSLQLDVASCGLKCSGGHPADERAIKFAAEIDLDLSLHRTTPIKDISLAEDDLLVVMEPIHLEQLKQFDLNAAQVTLAGLWGQKKSPYIHDPYSAIDEHFEICGKKITSAVEAIVERL